MEASQFDGIIDAKMPRKNSGNTRCNILQQTAVYP